MMDKVHYSDDQEDLFQEMGGHMARLIDTERGVKSAASDLVTKELLEAHRPDKDHFLIHCIAMGDTETYGPNRNADGWSKEALAKKHQTFVTNGHFFREHRNRDPKLKIGDIKYASYDPKGMGRVELLVWGHKKLAEAEYQDALEGKPRTYSMSAKVAYDVCNACGNKARNRGEYCACMKKHALEYIPEFKKYAYVDNPNPNFFDISDVNNRADRIALYLQYAFGDDMAKAASSSQVILGSEWAEFEGLSVPSHVIPEGPAGKVLCKMASFAEEVEAAFEGQTTPDFERLCKVASGQVFDEELTDVELNVCRSVAPGTLFRELAKKAAILPLASFHAYVDGITIDAAINSPVYKAARCGMMKATQQAGQEGLPEGVMTIFQSSGSFPAHADLGRDDLVKIVMSKADEAFGISPEKAEKRIMRISCTKNASEIIEIPELTPEQESAAYTLKKAYISYQAQALADMQKLAGDVDIEQAYKITVLSNGFYR